MIVSCADDQGRFLAQPSVIRAKVFPYDDIDLSEIKDGLQILRDAGAVLIYQSDGNTICQILNWWKYQNPSWAMKSRYPPPENWVDREKYHVVGNKVFTQNWDSKGGMQPLCEDIQDDLPSHVPTDVPTRLGRGIKESEIERREENNERNADSRDDPKPEKESRKENQITNVKTKPVFPLGPNSLIQDNPEVKNRGALDALQRGYGNRNSESSAADTAWVPEDIRPLARAFLTESQLDPPFEKKARGYWVKVLRAWLAAAHTCRDIEDTVGYMSSQNLTISGPQSITGIMASRRAEGKRKTQQAREAGAGLTIAQQLAAVS